MPPSKLQTLRERLRQLVRPVPDDFLPLHAGATRIGALSPDFADRVLVAGKGLMQRAGRGLRLDDRVSGEALTSRWGALAEALRGEGWFSAWRDETYDVRLGDDQGDAASEVLCRLERGVFRRFGLRSRAVHVNGVTPDGRMWIARRSSDKAIDPGRLDNVVGGGIASGEGPAVTLARECAEEAGIPQAIVAGARPAGVLRVQRPEGEGMHDEWLHAFTIVLPDDFRPNNADGEVAGFQLVDAEELAARILAGEFTEDAAAVASLWLLARPQ